MLTGKCIKAKPLFKVVKLALAAMAIKVKLVKLVKLVDMITNQSKAGSNHKVGNVL